MDEDEQAVSPVIAVILMVAITVVLAATVYVWVSGFSDGGDGAPTGSVTLKSDGATGDCAGSSCKNLTIASATPGMKYEDLLFYIDGTEYTFEQGTCSGATAGPANDGKFHICRGTAAQATSASVKVGDKISFRAASADTLKDATLMVVDSESNTQIREMYLAN